jgi:hypothetical protein
VPWRWECSRAGRPEVRNILTTPEQHNKYLGISHLVFGGLHLLMGIGFSLLFFVMFRTMPQGPGQGDPPPDWFFIVFPLFFLMIYGVMSLPPLIAGYALLKRKSWAKIAAIIGGVLAAMQFPIGTAVCVYTFWFLFSDPGKILYDKTTSALPPAPPVFGGAQAAREYQYVPSRTPPDWR